MYVIDARLKIITDHFGFGSQSEKTIEELAELIAAIKHLKNRDENAADHLVNFIEELANAKIMIDQLIYLSDKIAPDNMKVDQEIERKIQRALERMWAKKSDMHPDAIAARKFMEKDPETLKRLGIFD